MRLRLRSPFPLTLIGAALFLAGVGVSTWAQTSGLKGFKLRQVTFDNSVAEAAQFQRNIDGKTAVPATKPTPKIPREWRLVGVSQGPQANATNLWSQDPVGSVVLVRGFMSEDNEFTLLETINQVGAQ